MLKLFFCFIFCVDVFAVLVCDLSYSKISDEDKYKMTLSLNREMPDDFPIVDNSVSNLEDIFRKIDGEVDDRDIGAITLRGNLLKDATFKEVTRALKETKFVHNLRLLDLSSNALTLEICSDLIYWLQQPTIQYIDITSNTKLCNKKALDLIRVLKELAGSEYVDYSHKLIFLKRPYLYQASGAVQIYSQAVKEGLLSKSWYEIHKQYYKEPLIRLLKKFCYDIYTQNEGSLNAEGYESIKAKKISSLVRDLDELELSQLSSSLSSLKI